MQMPPQLQGGCCVQPVPHPEVPHPSEPTIQHNLHHRGLSEDSSETAGLFLRSLYFKFTNTGSIHLNYSNCRCPLVLEPIPLSPESPGARKLPLTQRGDQLGCPASRTHSQLQTFGFPSERCAQPGPAERFWVRAPISPTGSCGPKNLP